MPRRMPGSLHAILSSAQQRIIPAKRPGRLRGARGAGGGGGGPDSSSFFHCSLLERFGYGLGGCSYLQSEAPVPAPHCFLFPS